MKNIIQLFPILGLIFLISCGGTQENPTTDENTPTEIQSETWSDFWSKFQAASASKNLAAVKQLCHFGEHLQEKDIDQMFDVYFNEDMLALIAGTQAAEVPTSEDMGIDEERIISLNESGEDEEGNIYESALMLYFGKKDGKFGLSMLFAAG